MLCFLYKIIFLIIFLPGCYTAFHREHFPLFVETQIKRSIASEAKKQAGNQLREDNFFSLEDYYDIKEFYSYNQQKLDLLKIEAFFGYIFIDTNGRIRYRSDFLPDDEEPLLQEELSRIYIDSISFSFATNLAKVRIRFLEKVIFTFKQKFRGDWECLFEWNFKL